MTKDDLTDYLAAKALEYIVYCRQMSHHFFFRASQQQRKLIFFQDNNHEEDLPQCPGITPKPNGCTADGFKWLRRRVTSVLKEQQTFRPRRDSNSQSSDSKSDALSINTQILDIY